MDSRETNVLLLGVMILLIAFSAYQPSYIGYATKQCIDGDGDNIHYKGKVTVGGGYEAWDSCVNDVVQEFICKDGEMKFTFLTCPNGCDDGRCAAEEIKTKTPSGGEEFTFGTSGDQVEINEYLGDVQSALTEDEIDALRGGMLSTKDGITEFDQYLRFGNSLTTGKISFAENEDDDVGDYLYFEDSDYLFEYEIDFEDGLQSSIDGNKLEDIDDESIIILGRDYTIADAEKNGNVVTMRLVGGDYNDMISEGETKTYTIGGKEYIIEALNIDDMQRKVTLNIDGKMSKQLGEGDTMLFNGVIIGIGDIFIHESAEGIDFVKLFLSARTLILKDDASDDSFTAGVKIDGQSFGEGLVKIKGSTSGSDYKILSIAYRLQPDVGGGDLYIAPGHGAREYIDAPGAFLGSWDIVYDGLKNSGTSMITFDPSGNSQYNLKFANNKGQPYTLGIAQNNGGSLAISDGGHSVHFIEGTSSSNYIIKNGDYLILTSENDHTGATNIARYDSIDTTSKTIHFDEAAEGGKSVSYSGTEGTDASGDLIVSGHTYKAYIGGAPDYSLAVDLDSDGDADGSEVKIVAKGGAIIDLGSSVNPGNDFDMTLTTQASQFDENNADEVITIGIVKNGNDVDLTLNSQNSLSIETDNSKTKAMSRYGVYIEKDNHNPDRMTIEYPLSQSLADVKIVFAAEDFTAVATEEGKCGNKKCDHDEGYMNCPADCKFIKIKEEEPAIVQNKCGNGICDEEIDSCPADCVIVEQPSIVETAEKGFFVRLWEWVVAIFT